MALASWVARQRRERGPQPSTQAGKPTSPRARQTASSLQEGRGCPGGAEGSRYFPGDTRKQRHIQVRGRAGRAQLKRGGWATPSMGGVLFSELEGWAESRLDAEPQRPAPWRRETRCRMWPSARSTGKSQRVMVDHKLSQHRHRSLRVVNSRWRHLGETAKSGRLPLFPSLMARARGDVAGIWADPQAVRLLQSPEEQGPCKWEMGPCLRSTRVSCFHPTQR